MTIIAQRQFIAQIFNGQLTGFYSSDAKIAEMTDPSIPAQVLATRYVTGSGQIATGESYTVPMPEDYTNASYMAVYIGTPDVLKLVIGSPDHADSTVLLKGGTDQDGIHATVEHIDDIVIHNTEAGNVEFWYVLIQLPDISDEDNFRGLQVGGDRTSVS